MQGSAQVRVAAVMDAATRGDGLIAVATAYHLATDGRAWRARLVLDACRALQVDAAHAADLAAACELVHQASVVHDDVQDRAMLRRGMPSVVARYGMPAAICVGDLLLVRAFAVLAPLPNAPALVGLFADRIGEMVQGQGEEFSADLWQTMSRTRYHHLASAKAGALVALAMEGAAMLGGRPATEVAAAGRVARLLGEAYQACDDAGDLASDLATGALNGVIAWALDTGEPVQHARLHALLARARGKGLSSFEAGIVAAGLARETADLLQWAHGRVADALRLLGDDPFDAMLATAAVSLAGTLDLQAQGQSHAA